MQTKIQPVTVFPDSATDLKIQSAQVINFGENGSAELIWQLLSSEGRVLKSGSVIIDGDDYQSWNNDEPFLINWLLAKLTLTKLD